MKPLTATYIIRRKHLELEDLEVRVEQWEVCGRREFDLFVNGRSWGEGLDGIKLMECLRCLSNQGVKNRTIYRAEAVLRNRLRDAESRRNQEMAL
jgi:hypothetical protein